jgi:hypothetical protein
MQAEAGEKWIDLGLVFTTRHGTPLDAATRGHAIKTASGHPAGHALTITVRHAITTHPGHTPPTPDRHRLTG